MRINGAKKAMTKKGMAKNLKNTLTMLNMELLEFGNTFMRIDNTGKVTKSAIDHAMINENDRVLNHRKIQCSFTDHDAISVTITMKREKHTKDFKKIKARKIKNIRNNPEKFNRLLSKIQWDKLGNMANVNQMVEFWNAEIEKVLDEMAPEILKSSKTIKKIGLSKATKDQVEIRDSLKAQVGQLKTNTDSALATKYREQRNLCNRLIKAQKEKILLERLMKSLDKTEIWKIVNEIRKPKKAGDKLTIKVNDILIDDEDGVATEFNNYFIEKVGKLTEKIDKSLAVDPTIQLEQKRGAQRDSNHRFQLSTISENDTKEIIQDLK